MSEAKIRGARGYAERPVVFWYAEPSGLRAWRPGLIAARQRLLGPTAGQIVYRFDRPA
jgi:hypothetical protein